MTILLLRGYNNYFNRIVKQENSITNYKTASTSYLEYGNVNFDYQDGILTSIIVGNAQQLEQSDHILDFESGDTPDYLIVHNNVEINSRWFVLECVKIRGGQYKLALKRDVLVDYYDSYINAPCFIEKGYINNIQNPLLYNKENNVVNEIKQNETLIKDWSKCSWLVGYMKKDATATVSGILNKDLSKYTSANSLPFKDCIEYIDIDRQVVQSPTKTCIDNNGKLKFYFKIYNSPAFSVNGKVYANVNASFSPFNFDSASNGLYEGVDSCALTSSDQTWNANDSYKENVRKINERFNHNQSFRDIFYRMTNVCTSELYTQHALLQSDASVLEWNDKLVQKDNKVYKLTITKATQLSKFQKLYTFNDSTAGEVSGKALFQEIGDNVADLNIRLVNPTSPKFSFSYETNIYAITAEEQVLPGTITATIPGSSNRIVTNDAIYDIFAIPYNPDPNTSWEFKYNGNTYVLDSEVSLLMANLLITQLGLGDAGYAYDLQLLPYCPLIDRSNAGYPINCGYGSDKSFSIIEDASHKAYSFICFPEKSNFSVNIPLVKNYKHTISNTANLEWTNKTATYNDDGDLYMLDASLFVIPETASNLRGIIKLYYGNTVIDAYPSNQDLPDSSGPIAIWSYNALQEYAITFWIFGLGEAGNTITINRIYAPLTYDVEADPTPLEMKINNECDFMRLTSPNFNGIFQFKLSKLNGGIHYINADCTYKPVNPYIKLNPDYSFLYGEDFNDITGLLLNGDFSLPLLTDPWNQYELANRNYQNIFNRQIQDLDINQRIAREQQEFQGITGILTGGVAGAGAGAYAGLKSGGGAYGAGIGAAVGLAAGAGLGAAGYLKDRDWLSQAQGEAKSYAIDNYRYQLGTVQALPQSATKSTPLSYNNKIWPILEEFSCTPEEKEVIRNKVIYDGMTINAIGLVSDYNTSNEIDKVFVKGKLIRIENIKDDFHVADAIYQEVDKGFYVKGE